MCFLLSPLGDDRGWEDKGEAETKRRRRRTEEEKKEEKQEEKKDGEVKKEQNEYV